MAQTGSTVPPLVGTALIADPAAHAPEMQFGNGTQANATPGFYASLPAIYGPQSPWSVIEWNKSEYLDPTQMARGAAGTFDPLLGDAAYSWATPNGASALSVYGNGTTSPWVYDLRSSGGLLTAGGGSNLFLSDGAIAPGATFDKTITYQLSAKISEAAVSYQNAAARTNGSVLAQAFSGFTLWFNEPGTSAFDRTLPSFSVFMQIPITDSNNGAAVTDYRSASALNGIDGLTLVYGHVLPSDATLPFAGTANPPSTLRYNLNAYLSDLIAQPWPVADAGGKVSWVWLPAAVDNFSDWTLTSSYVGLETQNADGRVGASRSAQGTASLGLQISDLQIARDTTAPASPASFASHARVGGLAPSQIETFATWRSSSTGSGGDAGDGGEASASNGGTLPDVSGSLTPRGEALLGAALGALQGSGQPLSVVATTGGNEATAAVAGATNALVVTAGAGFVGMPPDYQILYLLGGDGVTLSDVHGGALLVATSQNDTLIGAANDTLIGGNGASTLSATAGATTIVGGSGGNLITLADSDADLYSQGSDTILGGSGRSTVEAFGTPLYFGARHSGGTEIDTFGASATLVGGGAETVNAGASDALVFGGADGIVFNGGSGASTVVSGSGGGTLNGGDAGTLFFGTGPTSYNAASGAASGAGSGIDTVISYAGGMTATGGANGTLFFTAQAGGNDLTTGTGSTTIIGFGAGDIFRATGAGNNAIEAGGASETIDGSAAVGTNSFFAFASDDVVIGGAGETAIQSAFGNQTLIAGSGATLFEILDSAVSHAITIRNFDPAHDSVQLHGYGAGAATAALASATSSGGSEILTLSDGATVTFQGLTHLDARSFAASA